MSESDDKEQKGIEDAQRDIDNMGLVNAIIKAHHMTEGLALNTFITDVYKTAYCTYLIRALNDLSENDYQRILAAIDKDGKDYKN